MVDAPPIDQDQKAEETEDEEEDYEDYDEGDWWFNEHKPDEEGQWMIDHNQEAFWVPKVRTDIQCKPCETDSHAVREDEPHAVREDVLNKEPTPPAAGDIAYLVKAKVEEQARNEERSLAEAFAPRNLAATQETRIKIKEADEILVPPFPDARSLRGWKMQIKKAVAAASGRPSEAYQWMVQADQTLDYSQLSDHDGFETLNAKLATALLKTCKGEFQRTIEIQEDKETGTYGRMLNGRQIYCMIVHHLQATTVDTGIMEIQDLFKLELKNDNLKGFINDWERTLLAMTKLPETDILETLFQTQISKSKQFESTYTMYIHECYHKS